MVRRSQFVRLSDILENIDAVSEMIEGVELGGIVAISSYAAGR
jgi:hypothetical protein